MKHLLLALSCCSECSIASDVQAQTLLPYIEDRRRSRGKQTPSDGRLFLRHPASRKADLDTPSYGDRYLEPQWHLEVQMVPHPRRAPPGIRSFGLRRQRLGRHPRARQLGTGRLWHPHLYQPPLPVLLAGIAQSAGHSRRMESCGQLCPEFQSAQVLGADSRSPCTLAP